MRATPISCLFKALRIRALLAVSAVGIAVLPAWQEHRARVAAAAVEDNSASLPLPPAPAPPPTRQATLLLPNPDLLPMVKAQTANRPTFDKKASNYEELIQTTAREHDVSPALVKAVIQAESRFNSHAISAQGAVGLMQILPSTARSVGVSTPHAPRENVLAGVRYLKTLLEEFGDEEYLAVAAYNCGPEIIKRYGNKIPPYGETNSFVAQVMEYYQSHIES